MSSDAEARVCSVCGLSSARDARYCAQCGHRLAGDAQSPRYYGALSPGPALVLGCVLLAAGIVALVAGSLIAAILLVALAVVAFVLVYDAARRDPTSPVSRRVFSPASHLRGWALFAREATSAWARAVRDVLRLRGESRSLRRERESALRSLGEAAYLEDEPTSTTLRQRLHEVDEELAKRDEARAETLAGARRRVDEERAAARSTQRFSVDDLRSGERPSRRSSTNEPPGGSSARSSSRTGPTE